MVDPWISCDKEIALTSVIYAQPRGCSDDRVSLVIKKLNSRLTSSKCHCYNIDAMQPDPRPEMKVRTIAMALGRRLGVGRCISLVPWKHNFTT
jgi:hypothetical protein